jgi:hypothetical protein
VLHREVQGRTYFEERADDGQNDDGEHGHDDAAALLAFVPWLRRPRLPYHDHAFIAETTGFTMVGGSRLRDRLGARRGCVGAIERGRWQSGGSSDATRWRRSSVWIMERCWALSGGWRRRG